uniref:Uncharacterized protein n=1 Tax=Macrostomum lignano TaxID=282301 RepID=A0A1I8FI93_9PLAT
MDRGRRRNKREMCKAGGLQEARRLLETSPDQDVNWATAVMWNISVSPTLKKDVLDTCLDTLVQRVLLPHAGFRTPRARSTGLYYFGMPRRHPQRQLLRRLRQAAAALGRDGLVESLRQIIQCAVRQQRSLTAKAVENCVRGRGPAYLRRHAARATGAAAAGAAGAGCFGRRSRREAPLPGSGASGKPGATSGAPTIIQRRLNGPPRGMDLLWQLDIVPLLLPIVATARIRRRWRLRPGALQNLAACDWQPSWTSGPTVRKERGLPLLVELLGLDADKDERNKDLIGQIRARGSLTGRLPGAPTPQGAPAVQLEHELGDLRGRDRHSLHDNFEFSRHFLELGGRVRLADELGQRPGRRRYGQKVVRLLLDAAGGAVAHPLSLQPLLRQAGWTEAQFTSAET